MYQSEGPAMLELRARASAQGIAASRLFNWRGATNEHGKHRYMCGTLKLHSPTAALVYLHATAGMLLPRMHTLWHIYDLTSACTLG